MLRCVRAWLAVHCLSLGLVTRINCSWFEVEIHCRCLVFLVVGWYALLQAGSLVRGVRCGGRHTTECNTFIPLNRYDQCPCCASETMTSVEVLSTPKCFINIYI
jgi:hypothetical protein